MGAFFARQLFVTALFFLIPATLFAATTNTIFDVEVLQDESAAEWQIFNTQNDEILVTDDGVQFVSNGDAFLVYPIGFSYDDFDQLTISVKSDQPLEVTVIPNVSSTALNTFELKNRIPADQMKTLSFSLRLPFFKNKISDLGINFKSTKPATITVQQITLEKLNAAEVLLQAGKDYFRVAPYSPFTVNLIPTPRVFGKSAMVYGLVFVVIALWLLLRHERWLVLAAGVLIFVWVATDARMMYEFFVQRQIDNALYVEAEDRQLRTYGDFYQFSEWVGNQLEGRQAFNLFAGGSAHYPRIMKYLVYPKMVLGEGRDYDYFVVYHRDDILFDDEQDILTINGAPLTEEGEIISQYDGHSFIFQEL